MSSCGIPGSLAFPLFPSILTPSSHQHCVVSLFWDKSPIKQPSCRTGEQLGRCYVARGQLGAAGGGAPHPPPAPHRASYQVAHSCCQITPLLAAGSAPFPRLFPLWLRQLLFLSSAAPPSHPQYTHPTQTDSIRVPKMAAVETCPDCTLSSQDRRLAPLGALAWAPCFVLACWIVGPTGRTCGLGWPRPAVRGERKWGALCVPVSCQVPPPPLVLGAEQSPGMTHPDRRTSGCLTKRSLSWLPRPQLPPRPSSLLPAPLSDFVSPLWSEWPMAVLSLPVRSPGFFLAERDL